MTGSSIGPLSVRRRDRNRLDGQLNGQLQQFCIKLLKYPYECVIFIFGGRIGNRGGIQSPGFLAAVRRMNRGGRAPFHTFPGVPGLRMGLFFCFFTFFRRKRNEKNTRNALQLYVGG